MGKYFDERLTDEEGCSLCGDDVYDVHDIFETRDKATQFISEKYRLTEDEVNKMWDDESQEFYSTLEFRKEHYSQEIAKECTEGERVADLTENQLDKMSGDWTLSYCLFQSGRVALVEFY